MSGASVGNLGAAEDVEHCDARTLVCGGWVVEAEESTVKGKMSGTLVCGGWVVEAEEHASCASRFLSR